METKFTSGEWVARKSRTGATTIQHDEQGFLIATIAGVDEKAANAKLIAASPDLFAAALDVLNVFPEGTMNNAQIKALASLNKAIKKATN